MGKRRKGKLLFPLWEKRLRQQKLLNNMVGKAGEVITSYMCVNGWCKILSPVRQFTSRVQIPAMHLLLSFALFSSSGSLILTIVVIA